MSEGQIVIKESSEVLGGVTVVIKGAFTIPLAAEAHSALVAAIAKGEQVLLDLEQVDVIDLTALQLICAAHKSAAKAGKLFQLSGHHTESLVAAAAKSGFSHRIRCMKEIEHCFWSGGAA